MELRSANQNVVKMKSANFHFFDKKSRKIQVLPSDARLLNYREYGHFAVILLITAYYVHSNENWEGENGQDFGCPFSGNPAHKTSEKPKEMPRFTFSKTIYKIGRAHV